MSPRPFSFTAARPRHHLPVHSRRRTPAHNRTAATLPPSRPAPSLSMTTSSRRAPPSPVAFHPCLERRGGNERGRWCWERHQLVPCRGGVEEGRRGGGGKGRATGSDRRGGEGGAERGSLVGRAWRGGGPSWASPPSSPEAIAVVRVAPCSPSTAPFAYLALRPPPSRSLSRGCLPPAGTAEGPAPSLQPRLCGH